MVFQWNFIVCWSIGHQGNRAGRICFKRGQSKSFSNGREEQSISVLQCSNQFILFQPPNPIEIALYALSQRKQLFLRFRGRFRPNFVQSNIHSSTHIHGKIQAFSFFLATDDKQITTLFEPSWPCCLDFIFVQINCEGDP